jgi:hypothetical protein
MLNINPGTESYSLGSLYNSYQNASVEISDRILLIRTHWFKTERQLSFLERTWAKLDADHQEIQSLVLRSLVSKLEAAINELQRLEKKHLEGDIGTKTESTVKQSDYKE